jgi:hypothetical protein
MAREAGRLVGVLHQHLAAFDYMPQGSIPHFHDTAFILAALQNVYPQLPDEVRGMADDIIATLPSLIMANEPQQLIHGDLKISNLIFDDLGHAVGIIGLTPSSDMPAPLTWAMRSARGATARLKMTRTRRSMSPSSRPPHSAMPRALVSPPVQKRAPGIYVPPGRSRSNLLHASSLTWYAMLILVLTPRAILIVVPTMWRVRVDSITWRRRFPAPEPAPRLVQMSVLCHNTGHKGQQIIGLRRKCMRLIIDRDVPVEMRDGTVLRADVYRPESAAPWPVLLQRTPMIRTSRVSQRSS